MPLDNSAMPTTATNSATYLVNSRLRIFVPGPSAFGTASAAGAAASVWRSEVPGCGEMLISRNLAGANDFVSCLPRLQARHARGCAIGGFGGDIADILQSVLHCLGRRGDRMRRRQFIALFGGAAAAASGTAHARQNRW